MQKPSECITTFHDVLSLSLPSLPPLKHFHRSSPDAGTAGDRGRERERKKKVSTSAVLHRFQQSDTPQGRRSLNISLLASGRSAASPLSFEISIASIQWNLIACGMAGTRRAVLPALVTTMLLASSCGLAAAARVLTQVGVAYEECSNRHQCALHLATCQLGLNPPAVSTQEQLLEILQDKPMLVDT